MIQVGQNEENQEKQLKTHSKEKQTMKVAVGQIAESGEFFHNLFLFRVELGIAMVKMVEIQIESFNYLLLQMRIELTLLFDSKGTRNFLMNSFFRLPCRPFSNSAKTVLL